MTTEKLHRANELQGKINLIDELEKDSEQYRKERFSGAMPSSVTRYLSDKPEFMLEVIDFIRDRAITAREGLQKQLNEL